MEPHSPIGRSGEAKVGLVHQESDTALSSKFHQLLAELWVGAGVIDYDDLGRLTSCRAKQLLEARESLLKALEDRNDKVDDVCRV